MWRNGIWTETNLSQLDFNNYKNFFISFVIIVLAASSPAEPYLVLQIAQTVVFCWCVNITIEILLNPTCFVEQLLIKELLRGSAERNSILSCKNGTYTYAYYGACVRK